MDAGRVGFLVCAIGLAMILLTTAQDLQNICAFEARFPGETDCCYTEELHTDHNDPTEASTQKEGATNPSLETTDGSTGRDSPQSTSVLPTVNTTPDSPLPSSEEPTNPSATEDATGGEITCPSNMVYGNCNCQGTCEEPYGSSSCPEDCEPGKGGCYCPAGFLLDGDECVPRSECPCFWSEVNSVIPNDHSQVNTNCTKRRSCTNNQLTDEENYQCDSDARCAVQDGVRQCYCNDGYRGDGRKCRPHFVDCYDAYATGHRADGVYLIKPTNWSGTAFNVSCSMQTVAGGGWTVFQRRTDGHTDFYRNWASYREGFGSFDGDFWLGNEKVHHMTNQKAYKLRVDFLTADNKHRYYEYSSFSIGTEDDKYQLTVTGPSGTADNGLLKNNWGAFSTYDSDNDGCETHNFAEMSRGAWWYHSSICSSMTSASGCWYFPFDGKNWKATESNLNGDYNGGDGQNIFWVPKYRDCNLRFVDMKIRPFI